MQKANFTYALSPSPVSALFLLLPSLLLLLFFLLLLFLPPPPSPPFSSSSIDCLVLTSKAFFSFNFNSFCEIKSLGTQFSSLARVNSEACQP